MELSLRQIIVQEIPLEGADIPPMVTLFTFPLQVPNDPAAVIEVGDFQAALLRRYFGEGSGIAIPGESASDPDESGTEEYVPTSAFVPWRCDASDGEGMREWAALAIYEKVSSNARLILNQLIDTWRQFGDDVPVTGQRIAANLGLEPAQFRGTLSSIEIRARAISRYNPISFERGPDGGRYCLLDEAADAFDWAREMYEASRSSSPEEAQDKIVALKAKLSRDRLFWGPALDYTGPDYSGLDYLGE